MRIAGVLLQDVLEKFGFRLILRSTGRTRGFFFADFTKNSLNLCVCGKVTVTFTGIMGL